MADDLQLPVDRLPTLTEVLDLGRELRVQAPTLADVILLQPGPGPAPVVPVLSVVPLAQALPAAASCAEAAATAPRIDEEALLERVLALLLPRVDSLLEARVSEALAPALARAADTLIRESRDELVRALRDLAAESLAQVLRQDGRCGGHNDSPR